jgi:hypothetical protein
MKKLLLVAVLAGTSGIATAKHVDMQTAKSVGLHFLESKVGQGATSTSLELVYTAKAADGKDCYYVFNAGDKAFVMVAADDQVKPVFGYSTETSFDVNNIPSNATGMLDDYKHQIEYVVANNVPATAAISSNWDILKSGTNVAQRTTAGVTPVLPLILTKWNQNPLYNQLCPMDNGALSVTGCVATAMAQAMKYWNYPKTGNGSHSYSSPYGTLSADFGATTYDWNSMPAIITSNNTAVATLNYHAGVSVDMNYSAQESGAWVIEDDQPICSEAAFKQYFKYKSTLKGVWAHDYSREDWIDLLMNELDHLRPVIYVGYIPQGGGGHCWLADGYDADKMMHINWGWGGASNGYFDVEGMNPPILGTGGGTGGGFNERQQAIIGLEPANMGTPDAYERDMHGNNIKENAWVLPLNTVAGSSVEINTEGSDFHVTNDLDFYQINLPIGDNYTVTARLQDAANSNNGKTYTLNVKFSMSTNKGASWQAYNDSTAAALQVNGGGTVLFRIAPNVVGDMGTYRLDIKTERTPTGVENVNNNEIGVSIYPNPANNMINVSLSDTKATTIALVDIQGRIVKNVPVNGSVTAIATDGIANGLYFVHIKSGDKTLVRKVTVAH